MKLRAAVAAIGLLLALTNPITARAAAFSVDPKPQMVANLKPCVAAADLDCIVGVSTVNDDGVATEARFLSYQNQGKETDDKGNLRYKGQINYSGMSMTAELETPNHVIFQNLTGGALRLFIQPDSKHAKSLFKIQFRTSWLKPQDIQMKAENANYWVKDIAGGKLWTFYGTQTQMSYYNSNYNKKMASGAKADATFPAFEIFIHHSDPRGSYFPTRCDDFGYSVESHNAPGAGQPNWNPATESLDFNIQAPHLKSNGSLNIGFFQFWANDEYMDCMWPGNGITTAKNVLVVSVIDQDGEVQIATSFISHVEGTMVLSVKNLHFSAPTIRVSEAKTSNPTDTSGATVGATPEPKPVVKKTITCVKGKTTKKVTAVAPKCPAGFKKK